MHDDRMKSNVKACHRAFGAVVGFSFATNLLMLTAPLFMLQVFNRVLTSRSEETLVVLLAMAVAALLVYGVLDGLRSRILVRVGDWLDGHLGADVLRASVHLSAARGGTAGSGVQPLRDLALCRGFLSGPHVLPIMDAPWAPLFVAVMFLIHPWMGWISVGGALLLFSLALVNEVATRRGLEASGRQQAQSLAVADATVRNADAVHAMGMFPALSQRWAGFDSPARSAQSGVAVRGSAIGALSKAARFLLQIGLLAAGALLVIRGDLTAGAMIASSILMSRAVAPVEQSIGGWRSAVQARAAWKRIGEHLAGDPSGHRRATDLPRPTGRLHAEKVTFRYPGHRDPELRQVSLDLPAGQAMGLIGPSGSGKTTLAKMIVGTLTPDSGAVRVDAMDVAVWNADNLGRYVGYLPQDVELFAGTVAENIARMASEPDTDAMLEAARLADVHEMVAHLPDGYDTQIGPGGAALSGGQRQRIGLARALYGNPALVVLDEPNANLDSTGEAALLKALLELKQRRTTVVIIAHRASVLRHVDQVLVLQNGAVKSYGPPAEILQTVRAANA